MKRKLEEICIQASTSYIETLSAKTDTTEYINYIKDCCDKLIIHDTITTCVLLNLASKWKVKELEPFLINIIQNYNYDSLETQYAFIAFKNFDVFKIQQQIISICNCWYDSEKYEKLCIGINHLLILQEKNKDALDLILKCINYCDDKVLGAIGSCLFNTEISINKKIIRDSIIKRIYTDNYPAMSLAIMAVCCLVDDSCIEDIIEILCFSLREYKSPLIRAEVIRGLRKILSVNKNYINKINRSNLPKDLVSSICE
jgi:hypothetical protein